jgi:antirestriction protein ArdC
MTTTKKPKSDKARRDLYAEFSAKLIAKSIEDKRLIWHQSWKNVAGDSMFPVSLSTGRNYRGINPWILMAEALDKGYKSNRWATYNEWARQGGMVRTVVGQNAKGRDIVKYFSPVLEDGTVDPTPRGVRKGEKGTEIVLWIQIYITEIDEVTGKKSRKRIPFLKTFHVWNQDQVAAETLPEKLQPGVADEAPEEFNPIEAAEAIFAGYTEVPVSYGGNRAYYSPSADRIGLPERHQFTGAEEFYSTAFHEYGHSTGHASRLARKDLMEMHHFGDTSYSKEELVAEMTAAMLCGVAGIENSTFDNSAAYLQGWLRKLESEPKWLVQAATKASEAADYIQGIKYAKEEQEGSSEPSEEAVLV